MNVFLYQESKHLGISSTIEKAIAVRRPVAITRCGMFRHVLGTSPSICIDDHTLPEILEAGIAPLVPYCNEWSEDAFILDYERIVGEMLELGPVSRTGSLASAVSG